MMRKLLCFCSSLLLLVLAAGYSNAVAGPSVSAEPLTTVDSVDLERYAGLWYEVAKIPNRYQKKCVSGTTARYSLRDDGRMEVLNSCMTKAGKPKKAKGIARVVDAETDAKLKVSFVKLLGKRMFWADYWIVGLGDEYEYAIVGQPSRKYGWILSRSPQMTEEQKTEIYAELRALGYNPDAFEETVFNTSEVSIKN